MQIFVNPPTVLQPQQRRHRHCRRQPQPLSRRPCLRLPQLCQHQRQRHQHRSLGKVARFKQY